MTAKSISIKRVRRRFGGCVRKAVVLTSGGLDRVLDNKGLRESRETLTVIQKSAEGIVTGSSRSTRSRHSPERGETARGRTDRERTGEGLNGPLPEGKGKWERE
jgi:hypothetical protein